MTGHEWYSIAWNLAPVTRIMEYYEIIKRY